MPVSLYKNFLGLFITTKLCDSIYKNYLHEDYLYHLKRNSSDLIRIITNEINFVIQSVFLPLLIVFMEILVVIGITLLLLSVETRSTIYVLVTFLLLGTIYFRIISKKLKKWGGERLYHEGKKLQNITQGLHGIKIVKMFNQEKTFLDQFNINASGSAKVGQYAAVITQIPRLSIEFIAVFLIVFFMVYNVQLSTNVTEFFPKLALFAAAAFRLLPSMNRLVNNLQTLRYASPAVNKIHNEFPLKTEIPSKINLETKIDFNDEINISNLSFRYPENDENILQDINLKIKCGESIGFIGKTGAGKSTLIDIICGLLNPQDGKILVDKKNIKDNIGSWQQQIGYVPQNVYLLDDTIKQNIIFGKTIDNDENLMDSIKLAQLDKLISKLPEGINTKVGERGARLSGGQIQRIGIARAINNNAKILIFDESTSALDVETEKELINDIYKLKSKKTLIIISHRISVLEHCDRVYSVKNKNIFLEK
jgi:ABC-type multidrug transport system fused ATPase/permease subunit